MNQPIDTNIVRRYGGDRGCQVFLESNGARVEDVYLFGQYRLLVAENARLIARIAELERTQPLPEFIASYQDTFHEVMPSGRLT